MGKKKNKKNKSAEADQIPQIVDDQNKEDEMKKTNKFELIGKIVVGAGVGLLGVGAAVFGIFRGKGKKDEAPETDQVAEELPDYDEVPETEE